LTSGQVAQIKKYAENVCILYDGDAAGMAAADKAITLFLEQDINPFVVLFPLPEDPDSYVRKVGAAAFEAYVAQNRLDFISFKLKITPQDPKNPFAKLKTLEEVVKLLAKIREPLKRAVFIKRAADMFEIAEEKINQEANKLISIQFQTQKNTSNEADPTNNDTQPSPEQANQIIPQHKINIEQENLTPINSQEYQERDIIRLLIQFGAAQFNPQQTVAEFVLDNMLDFIDEFENKLYSKIILEYMDYLDQNNNQAPHPNYFINHQQPVIAALAVDLLAPAARYEYSQNWIKWNVFLQSQQLPDLNHQKDSYYAVSRFKLRKIEKLCAKNSAELKKLQQKSQLEEEYFTNAIILIQVQMKLNALKAEFAKKTNTVVLK
jgi:DNA primase